MKIVLTLESRPSKQKAIDKILEILATKNVVKINDEEIF